MSAPLCSLLTAENSHLFTVLLLYAPCRLLGIPVAISLGQLAILQCVVTGESWERCCPNPAYGREILRHRLKDEKLFFFVLIHYFFFLSLLICVSPHPYFSVRIISNRDWYIFIVRAVAPNTCVLSYRIGFAFLARHPKI